MRVMPMLMAALVLTAGCAGPQPRAGRAAPGLVLFPPALNLSLANNPTPQQEARDREQVLLRVRQRAAELLGSRYRVVHGPALPAGPDTIQADLADLFRQLEQAGTDYTRLQPGERMKQYLRGLTGDYALALYYYGYATPGPPTGPAQQPLPYTPGTAVITLPGEAPNQAVMQAVGFDLDTGQIVYYRKSDLQDSPDQDQVVNTLVSAVLSGFNP